ncbi:DUF262 domain-containing protein [Microbacterium maritypicum]|uniref:DUF262 domain-containing protein n=1 Tax=Microbacterium maritypicum TaxID=33918 RepID=UPI003D7458FE
MNFHSSVGTISWFRDRYLEGTLSLRPSYQRLAVWRGRQKAYLVESVLKGLPIPEVFVQSTVDEHGSSEYGVVDGQQRIRALMQFIGAEQDEDQADFDSFSLDTLETASPWFGKRFSDLDPTLKSKFFSYQISIRYLESDSEDEIKEMFRRLNKFTSPLRPAELRNATYGGPFARAAVRLADDYADFLAENRIITAEGIRRMGDVEFMAELLIAAMHGPQGGGASIIDEYYQTYEDFEDEFPKERPTRRLLKTAIDIVPRLVPELRRSRWSNKSDFYSLVAAVTHLMRVGAWSDRNLPDLASTLENFGLEVEEYLGDEESVVSDGAKSYARAVSRGPNDKSRRATRHEALVQVLIGSAK